MHILTTERPSHLLLARKSQLQLQLKTTINPKTILVFATDYWTKQTLKENDTTKRSITFTYSTGKLFDVVKTDKQ
jgi:hypothetical protein